MKDRPRTINRHKDKREQPSSHDCQDSLPLHVDYRRAYLDSKLFIGSLYIHNDPRPSLTRFSPNSNVIFLILLFIGIFRNRLNVRMSTFRGRGKR